MVLPLLAVLTVAFTASASSASKTCAFDPPGPVQMDPGGVQLFFGNGDCHYAEVYTFPSDGTIGFDASCSTFYTVVYPQVNRFKLYACEPGIAELRVYQTSQLVQTITVDVGPY
jgi:hypothetical protein